ncbi:MAG: hypothetical protein AUJ12_09140 [Alphaproteobacteria bacterium CG1_02_46_17]|nr:MAG: hypothetical protein AUJ12_09140 [Alphaproteobacteria bacterium CG1_02_46_17]
MTRMTKYGLLTLSLCMGMAFGGVLISHPSFAEESVTAEVPADEYKERLALSRELHDVRRVKEHILQDIDNIAQSLPFTEREDFKKYIELNVDFDKLEDESIKISADTYTVPEFKAMLAYFGSKEGRAAEAKSARYGAQFGPKIQEQIDKALMASKFENTNQLPRSLPNIDMLGK